MDLVITASSNPYYNQKKTPPWIFNHFQKPFQSFYGNRKNNSSETDPNTIETKLIPEPQYIAPVLSVPSLASMPHDMPSMFRRIEKNCTSFRKADSVPNSNIELNITDQEIKTPEKCLSPLNYKWKSINSVTKVKRGKSVSNINTENSEEKILNISEQYQKFERTSGTTSKFTKRYLKMKIANIFRSTSKVNEQSKVKRSQHDPQLLCNSNKSTKSQGNISIEIINDDEAANDALRNLSFTAAMMSKSSNVLSTPSRKRESIDHTKQIPSSTLRFWRKPSEEKLKASQRRIQEDMHGSNEVLLRINPTIDNNKHPSELSLFFEDGSGHIEVMKVSNSDIRIPPAVPGYDKALNRYHNLISQSRHVSRKDRTLSLAYETETNGSNNKQEMRSSQSSHNMSSLTRSNSVVQGLNPDFKKIFVSDVCTSPSFRDKNLTKELFYQNPSKTHISNTNNINNNAAFLPPPPYDNTFINRRFVRMRRSSSKQPATYNENEYHFKSKELYKTLSQKAPKPPPRGDSLIRSFELICKNLTNSICEPRGDSFKMFKSQRDYENWLKNLPYNSPEKIATLLKMRSKIARRQCVSELIDIHMVNVDNDKKRRHSWPLFTNTNISYESFSNRRASSLSRVKKKIEIQASVKSLDSPSLCNYSRLYSLRNPETGKLLRQPQPEQQTSSDQATVTSPLSATRIRRPFKYRYRQINAINPKMTESCHESSSNSII